MYFSLLFIFLIPLISPESFDAGDRVDDIRRVSGGGRPPYEELIELLKEDEFKLVYDFNVLKEKIGIKILPSNPTLGFLIVFFTVTILLFIKEIKSLTKKIKLKKKW